MRLYLTRKMRKAVKKATARRITGIKVDSIPERELDAGCEVDAAYEIHIVSFQA